jgi:hypothetical protein
MEIMLSHFGIGMAYDALDGLNIHAQRLHRRYNSFCLMGLFDGAYNQIVGFWAILSIASNNFSPQKNWILECFSLTDCGISCKI